MCGIAGFTHRHGDWEPSRIHSSAKTLHHRGPDQSGTYEDTSVSLGAVRLKIIDLHGGDQPLFSEDGNTVLVFNGEIYNHAELRAELDGLGHTFSTYSDTEILLHAFLEWDTDCFRRLRGMFAAAFWNKDLQRLVLVRDRVGMKPLYVSELHGDLYFASELKALFVHPELRRELDHIALHYYLALNYVPGPRTLVQGIEKLPPGHFLEWTPSAVRTGCFWKPIFKQNPDWTLSSAQEALDQLLTDSLRDHLISDVPVGIWLSGGVDSSAILHYASMVCSSRLKTFSIGFAGRSFDEAHYAREIAKRYDTDHHELDLNPQLDLPAAIEQMVHYSDEPFADAGALPLWYLSKMSRERVTVALSGEGSDELFGGYLTYRADRLAGLARLVPGGLRRSLLGLLRYWPVSNEKISFEYKLKRFLEGSFLPPDEAHTYWNGSFCESQQKRILRQNGCASVTDLFEAGLPGPNGHGHLSRYLAFDQRYYLTDDLLCKVDRMSMAHSIEVRPPYLDHRIIEFAASLPDKFKIDGRRQKVVLKSLLKSKLPPAILGRSKTGLDIPTHDWFRGALRPMLLDTLRPSRVAQTGLFQQGAIDRLIADHLQCRSNVGYHLWGLLILFLWMKQWNIQTDSSQHVLELARKTVLSPA